MKEGCGCGAGFRCRAPARSRKAALIARYLSSGMVGRLIGPTGGRDGAAMKAAICAGVLSTAPVLVVIPVIGIDGPWSLARTAS